MCAKWCCPCQAYMPVEFIERNGALMFGVEKGALPLFVRQLLQQMYPTLVKPINQLQRNVNGQSGVGQRCPAVFKIRFHGGIIVRQSQFQANVGIEVAISYVMHHLSNRPAVGAVRRIQLRGRSNQLSPLSIASVIAQSLLSRQRVLLPLLRLVF